MKATDLELPLTLLKKFPSICDVDKLLKMAHSFTFSRAYVDQLETEYKERPDTEIMQICKLL